MNGKTLERVLLVLLGWGLSTVSGVIGYTISQKRHKRRLFTKVFRICEQMIIELEIAPAWRARGGIETIEGMLDMDDSWRRSVPVRPPSIPREFGEMIAEVSEWEALRGRLDLTRKLQGLENKLILLHQIHAGLCLQAQLGEEHISSRSVSFIEAELPEIRRQCIQILNVVYPLRLSWLRRIWWHAKRWLLSRRSTT